MSKYYVFDDYGCKQEAFTKEQAIEYFKTGAKDQTIYTAELTYNNELVSYNYIGAKPSDEYLVKLLDIGMNYENNLSSNEVSALLALGEFKILFFLCETNVYITNGHCDLIFISNPELGYKKIYVNSNETVYYVKANKETKGIYVCDTKTEYDSITKEAGVIYAYNKDGNVAVQYADEADTARYAESADIATKATQDGDGNTIANTYLKKNWIEKHNQTYSEDDGITSVNLSDITSSNYVEMLIIVDGFYYPSTYIFPTSIYLTRNLTLYNGDKSKYIELMYSSTNGVTIYVDNMEVKITVYAR